MRVAGEFFRRMPVGTLPRRAGCCVFLGPVGEVLCGTWGGRRAALIPGNPHLVAAG